MRGAIQMRFTVVARVKESFGHCRVWREEAPWVKKKITGIEPEAPKKTYLNPRLQRQVGVSGIAHFKNASKSVFSQVSNFQDFEVWRDGAEIEFADENVIDDDGRFGRFV